MHGATYRCTFWSTLVNRRTHHPLPPFPSSPRTHPKIPDNYQTSFKTPHTPFSSHPSRFKFFPGLLPLQFLPPRRWVVVNVRGGANGGFISCGLLTGGIGLRGMAYKGLNNGWGQRGNKGRKLGKKFRKNQQKQYQ